MSILEATHLSCEKSDRTLFSDLSLSIEANTLFYLKGDNGAGKTSLLRILVGLSAPNVSGAKKGTVLVNNIDVHTDINNASAQMLYLGHKLGLSSVLSCVENLSFWASQQNLAVSTDDILSVLDELEMTGLEHSPVKHLSAGQQRKVGLAKLWLKPNANLWVLDEPFTALDVHMIEHLSNKIKQFVEGTGAVIMTSHQALNIDYAVTDHTLEYQW